MSPAMILEAPPVPDIPKLESEVMPLARPILSPSSPFPALQRMVLTGFMGAGKSTVGRLLAEQMGWHFVDVDEAIEARAGMPVAEIFATLGEFVFRRLETSAIAHALGERHAVIALGGGAPEVLANRLLLEQTPQTAVILLEAPLTMLFERCEAPDASVARPVLQDRALAEKRFLYRTPLYRRIAKRTVTTSGQTPEETAAAVLETLGIAGLSL